MRKSNFTYLMFSPKKRDLVVMNLNKQNVLDLHNDCNKSDDLYRTCNIYNDIRVKQQKYFIIITFIVYIKLIYAKYNFNFGKLY